MHPDPHWIFFARFLRSRARFSRSSSFRYASFGTLINFLTALSIRSASVLPGTGGAGSGFILNSLGSFNTAFCYEVLKVSQDRCYFIKALECERNKALVRLERPLKAYIWIGRPCRCQDASKSHFVERCL